MRPDDEWAAVNPDDGRAADSLPGPGAWSPASDGTPTPRTRRDFLAVSAAGLGGVLLAAGCGRDGQRYPWRPVLSPEALGAGGLDLHETLRATFGEANLPGVRVVGRAYAQRFAPDAEALAADLRESLAPFRGLDGDPPSPAEAPELLLAAIRADLARMRLVSVEGWQLAVGEARLAALADVLPREGRQFSDER